MIEDMAGFVIGNVKRRQLVDVIEKNGPITSEYLSKRTRIPRLSVDKMLGELVEKNVVKIENGSYSLTPEGEQAIVYIRSIKSKGKDTPLDLPRFGDGRL